MDTKVCSKCGAEKPLSDFGKRRANRDGYSGWCRDCAHGYSKQNRDKNREKIRQQSRDRYAANKDKMRALDRERRRKKAIERGTHNADKNAKRRALREAWVINNKVKSLSKKKGRISGIYMIRSICKPQRFYIGSSVDVYRRWSEHKSTLQYKKHRSPKLQNHYNKYGVDDLFFCVLEECNDWELTLIEKYYIDNWKPFFNCAKETSCHRLGVKLSRTTKKKIGMAHKGKRLSAEHKAKMSAARKGKPKSDEWKRKIGDANRGKKMTKSAIVKSSLKRRGKKLILTPEERERRRKQVLINIANRRKKAS